MNTSNNTGNANLVCKTIGCGDRAYTHDDFTGKCNVVGCLCERFVGTCTFTWQNPNKDKMYHCTEAEGHTFKHTDGKHTWYTNGNPAQPDHAPLCVNKQHPASTFERMGGKVEQANMQSDNLELATAIVAACLCGEGQPHVHCPRHRSIPTFTSGNRTVEERYETARAGARKALGSSPLVLECPTSKDNGKHRWLTSTDHNHYICCFCPAIKMPSELPIETACNAVGDAQKPVRFTQIAFQPKTPYMSCQALFAIDAEGQLWKRFLNGKDDWQLDTMPVR